jgi:hypothetical protein
VRILLRARDFARDVGALLEQRENLVVDRVDVAAEVVQSPEVLLDPRGELRGSCK